MLQTKFVLCAVVALMIVNGAVAIIDGQGAAIGRFPYFVLLETFRTNEPRTIRHNCGGALIADQWIVTSARCLAASDGAQVHLGVQKFKDRKESGRQIFNVTKKSYHIHPKYRLDQPYVDDIATIKLPKPVQFSKYIQPIELSDSTAPSAISKDLVTLGYGLKNLIFEGIPDNLQYATFRAAELSECVQSPSAVKSIRKNGVVCGFVVQGRLCFGDIGAPLQSLETGKLVGIAISSGGHDCEVSRFQSFSGIAVHKKWIEGEIDADKPPEKLSPELLKLQAMIDRH